jgi:hypothetical protein
MEWTIESYDRRTDRDRENRFATESAFIGAAENLLRNELTGPRRFPDRDTRSRRQPIPASARRGHHHSGWQGPIPDDGRVRRV